jgi:O-acetyl-ADP-ribose deacetylase (regulator of RNase III)
MPEGGQATAQSIRDATQNTLQIADELDAQSLILPALGCGIAGFELEEGGRIIAEEIAAFDPESLTDVALIAYSDEDYETLSALATERSGAE